MDNNENPEYKDMNYAKKNKILCSYCSYRCAVPSKNNLFCSEMCRILHYTLYEVMDIVEISKLISLSKIDLISLILSLKGQKFTKTELNKILNKKTFKKDQIFQLKNGSYSIDLS